jgi:hypothetical protein
MFVLSDEERQARKFYDCDAYEAWKQMGPPDSELTADERLVLDGVRADEGKIRPGQRYRAVRFNDGAGIEVWRARLDMNSLCNRYELFDDA